MRKLLLISCIILMQQATYSTETTTSSIISGQYYDLMTSIINDRNHILSKEIILDCEVTSEAYNLLVSNIMSTTKCSEILLRVSPIDDPSSNTDIIWGPYINDKYTKYADMPTYFLQIIKFYEETVPDEEWYPSIIKNGKIYIIPYDFVNLNSEEKKYWEDRYIKNINSYMVWKEQLQKELSLAISRGYYHRISMIENCIDNVSSHIVMLKSRIKDLSID